MPEETFELSAAMGTDDSTRTASWSCIRTGMFEVLLTSFDGNRNSTTTRGCVSTQVEAEQACIKWIKQGISILSLAAC